MNILYLDGVGPFGGASRSLFESVRALSAREVRAHFVAARGTALDMYRQVAVDIVATRGLSRFDNTQYSHYRGVRWLVLLRELFHAPFTLSALLKARRRWPQIDLIHVNEITEIIPGLIAKCLFKVPLVVHVRSAQSARQRSWRTRCINHWLRRYADAVVAIDETVRGTLPSDLEVQVIHNAFTPSSAAHGDPAIGARLDALRASSLKVGFVGNLHVSKGLFDLLDAAILLKQQHAVDVEFVIVGGHTRAGGGLKNWLLKMAGLAQDLHGELLRRIAAAGLQDSFLLLGPTKDIQRVYERLDVIAFPSHFDAPGRPIFEAAFSGVPCIACISAPTPDTLIPRQTGLVVPARDPDALASAIRHFATDRSEVKRMGDQARELAMRNFDAGRNAGKLKLIYEKLLGDPSRP